MRSVLDNAFVVDHNTCATLNDVQVVAHNPCDAGDDAPDSVDN